MLSLVAERLNAALSRTTAGGARKRDGLGWRARDQGASTSVASLDDMAPTVLLALPDNQGTSGGPSGGGGDVQGRVSSGWLRLAAMPGHHRCLENGQT